MSRVEENAKVRKDISESMELVTEAADAYHLSGDARTTLINSAKMAEGVSYLEDISSSMAVIADSLSYIVEEEAQCKKEREEKWKDKEMPSYPLERKSMYLRNLESRFQKEGITKDEWNTWVGLRDKYLFGKKELEE